MNFVYNLSSSSLTGSIEIASELGLGTAFSMVFPLKLEGDVV
jgi:chemotaxis protein histidine kinase CheA